MTTPLTTTTKTITKDDILNYTVKDLSDTIKKGLNNKEEIITVLSKIFGESEKHQRDLQQIYLLIEKKITFDGDGDDVNVADNNNNNNKEEKQLQQQKDKKISENVNELLTTIDQMTEKVKQLQKKISKLETEKKLPAPTTPADGEHINVHVTSSVDGGEIYFKIKKITVLGKLMTAYRTRLNIQDNIGTFIFRGREITPEQTGEELGFGPLEAVDFVVEAAETGATQTQT